ARPASSIRVASSTGLECNATQAVKPTASMKKPTAALVSTSSLRRSPLVDLGAAIVPPAKFPCENPGPPIRPSDSVMAIVSQRTRRSTATALPQDEADDLGHGFKVGLWNHVVDFDGGGEGPRPRGGR